MTDASHLRLVDSFSPEAYPASISIHLYGDLTDEYPFEFEFWNGAFESDIERMQVRQKIIQILHRLNLDDEYKLFESPGSFDLFFKCDIDADLFRVAYEDDGTEFEVEQIFETASKSNKDIKKMRDGFNRVIKNEGLKRKEARALIERGHGVKLRLRGTEAYIRFWQAIKGGDLEQETEATPS